MMVSPLTNIFVAIFFTSITGIVGALIIRGKATKTNSELFIAEAKIAMLLTDINKVITYHRTK